MEQSFSIVVWDQDDPSTLKNVTEAIQKYQSVVLPCSSAEAVLFALQHRAVDAVILNLRNLLNRHFVFWLK